MKRIDRLINKAMPDTRFYLLVLVTKSEPYSAICQAWDGKRCKRESIPEGDRTSVFQAIKSFVGRHPKNYGLSVIVDDITTVGGD